MLLLLAPLLSASEPTAPSGAAAAPAAASAAAGGSAPAAAGKPARVCVLHPAPDAMFVVPLTVGGRPVGELRSGGMVRVDHPAQAEGTTYIDLQAPGLSGVTTVYARADGLHLVAVRESPNARPGAPVVGFEVLDERVETALVARCLALAPTPLP